MMEPPAEYERHYRLRFIETLGNGKDGSVFKTDEGQAVKFFIDADTYRRELRAYQILQRRDIDEVNGFQIPRLIRQDDAISAIEMTIVEAPFILDFASAYTQAEYNRFEFSEEVLDEREIHWAEIFGDRWPTVKSACEAFRRKTGLILLDLSLNNIKFPPG